jgi:small subunit ribosomal protein S19
MTRSIWKGPFIDGYVLGRALKAQKSNKLMKEIWSRRSVILPEFVGLKANIYNGQKWSTLLITEDMIGHKFGEFSPTRKVCQHKKKK